MVSEKGSGGPANSNMPLDCVTTELSFSQKDLYGRSLRFALFGLLVGKYRLAEHQKQNLHYRHPHLSTVPTRHAADPD